MPNPPQSNSPQAAWPLAQRLRCIKQFRRALIEQGDRFAAAIQRPAGEVWASEILPLADTCKFLEKHAPALLRERSALNYRNLLWMGIKNRIQRRPLGKILIIGPFNYPLFLPGSQCMQALVAGNQVIWKPGRKGASVAQLTQQILIEQGMPEACLSVTDESPQAGIDAMDHGVNLVIFTGSAQVGKRIAAKAAETLTPCIIEASGCDAVIICPGADLTRAAKAIHFGLGLNQGQTCISPRRIICPKPLVTKLIEKILQHVPPAQPDPTVTPNPLPEPVIQQAQALITEARHSGAKVILGTDSPGPTNFPPTLLHPIPADAPLCRSDLFAPLAGLIEATDLAHAIEITTQSPFALGISIFGTTTECQQLIPRLNAGIITCNDLIAPTAHPAASFGGIRQSGYGRTRGAAGLLACTQELPILTRRGNFLPHLDPGGMSSPALFRLLGQALHSPTLKQRLRALTQLSKLPRKNNQ